MAVFYLSSPTCQVQQSARRPFHPIEMVDIRAIPSLSKTVRMFALLSVKWG